MYCNYLNSLIEDEIYMQVPKFFDDTLEFMIEMGSRSDAFTLKVENILRQIHNENKVYRLRKVLYGLRQSGRSWIQRLDKALREIEVKLSAGDPCVYFFGRGEDLILIIYERSHGNIKEREHNR